MSRSAHFSRVPGVRREPTGSRASTRTDAVRRALGRPAWCRPPVKCDVSMPKRLSCRLMCACEPPLIRTPSSRMTSVTLRARAAAAASASGEYL
ncbi:hypothetical protein LQ51_29775 [Micromonospora sp. HK10]|nr:hypothetical protein LQ51_29775 [Micromonospora sp. HK10]